MVCPIVKVGIRVYFIIVTTCGSKGETEDAFITSTNYTWDEARTVCKLVGRQNNINVSSSNNRIVWIDATATYSPWFDYLGCFKVKQTQIKDTINLSTEEKLFECIQNCKEYRYIGLQISKCVCLKNTSLDGSHLSGICRQNERITCSGGNPLLCAIDNSDGRFVLYRIVDIKNKISKLLDGPGNCLGVSKFFDTITFASTDCNEQHQGICADNYNDVHVAGLTLESRAVWDNSTRICNLKSSSHQLATTTIFTLKKNEINLQSRTTYWLATLRQSVFRFSPETGSASSYCVAGEISRNMQLELHVKRCSDRLPALCDGTGTTDFKTDLNSGGNNDTLTIVLVIVSSLLVVVILVVIVLLIRSIPTRNGSRSINQAVENEQGVIYAQVDKSLKSNRDQGEQNMSSKSHSSEEDTYDHMNHTKTNTFQNKQGTENDYDTMQSVADVTGNDYDHSNEAWRPFILPENGNYSEINLEK